MGGEEYEVAITPNRGRCDEWCIPWFIVTEGLKFLRRWQFEFKTKRTNVPPAVNGFLWLLGARYGQMEWRSMVSDSLTYIQFPRVRLTSSAQVGRSAPYST